MSQQQHNDPWADKKVQFGFFLVIVTMFSTFLELLFRRIGSRGHKVDGLPAFFGFLLMPFLLAKWWQPGWPHVLSNEESVLLMMLSYLFLLAVHRGRSQLNRKRGQYVHSQFVGISKFEGPKCPQSQAFTLEIFAGAALAYFGFKLSSSVGSWLVVSTICLAIKNSIILTTKSELRDAMRDAEIEADWAASWPAPSVTGRLIITAINSAMGGELDIDSKAISEERRLGMSYHTLAKLVHLGHAIWHYLEHRKKK